MKLNSSVLLGLGALGVAGYSYINSNNTSSSSNKSKGEEQILFNGKNNKANRSEIPSTPRLSKSIVDSVRNTKEGGTIQTRTNNSTGITTTNAKIKGTRENIKKVENKVRSGGFSGSSGNIAYTDEKGNIKGSTDITRQASLTSQATKKVRSGGELKGDTLAKQEKDDIEKETSNKSSSSSDLNYTPYNPNKNKKSSSSSSGGIGGFLGGLF